MITLLTKVVYLVHGELAILIATSGEFSHWQQALRLQLPFARSPSLHLPSSVPGRLGVEMMVVLHFHMVVRQIGVLVG